MASYEFSCESCGERTEIDFPIGNAPRKTRCICGAMSHHVIGAGVQIAPSALETKGVEARAYNAREKRWDADMPAYRRMRHRGLQPKSIDGSARLEDQVDDQLAINHKDLLDSGVSRDRVIESVQMAAEISAEGVPI